MIYFVAGLAVLFVLFVLARAFVAADPAKLAGGLRRFGLVLLVVGAIGLGVFLVVSGQLGTVFFLGFAGLPFLARLRSLFNRFRPFGGAARGQTSDVETAYLKMSLDHDSGEMSGTVRRGPFLGRRLSELQRDELVSLWRECRAEDEPSSALLETYLDRAHPDWRDAASGPQAGSEREGARGGERAGRANGPSPSGAMTRQEAFEILGLAPGADPEAIRAAHRRLMVKMHPDHGGSTYLAARINQARDVLLGS